MLRVGANPCLAWLAGSICGWLDRSAAVCGGPPATYVRAGCILWCVKALRCVDGGGTHQWRRASPDTKRCAWCREMIAAKRVEPKLRRPLNQRSGKRAAISGERAQFVARLLAQRSRCELPPVVAEWADTHRGSSEIAALRLVLSGCTRRSVDVHEILSRGRGGKIVPSQGLGDHEVMCLCRSCHDWITTNPRISAALGVAITRPPTSKPTNHKGTING